MSQARQRPPALFAGMVFPCAIFMWAAAFMAMADSPASRSVQVAATVQTNPALITLAWPDNGATNCLLYRKTRDSTSWGPVIALATNATGYVDSNVVLGTSYDYRVARRVPSNPTYSFGYLYGGIELPMAEDRGKVILLVDDSASANLRRELERLQQDLVGEGWTVLRHDVPRMAVEPANMSTNVWGARAAELNKVKSLIMADYLADPARVKALFIFGHIPVPYSGNLAPDGHANHTGAWPADVYYADMTGAWRDFSARNLNAADSRNRNEPGDGKFDPIYQPSWAKADLQVGRVDLANLPAFALSETELLRQYLNKDHNFRHRLFTVERRGLISDNFGIFNGEAFAVNGWRNFAPFFGPSNITTGSWFATLSAQSFLWAYGCGGGTYTSASGIGSTTDFAANDPRVVFTMLFGSYFGDWDMHNNFLRAPLATPTYTLTCAWAGRPNWPFHHMALGETIGFSARLAQNNALTYDPNSNYQHVHIALMGDPTLRMHPVAPPSGLLVTTNAFGGTELRWNASPDTVVGYAIYRAPMFDGPYTRLNPTLVTATNYTDPVQSREVYMVRAVKLEVTPSGSYYNPSQGIFQSADTVIGVPSMGLRPLAKNWVAPGPVWIETSTFDPSNALSEVRFFANAVHIGSVFNHPFVFAWSNMPAGNYALSAQAFYAGGPTITSCVRHVSVDSPLLVAGTVWKYLDNGSDQGVAWQHPAFNDNDWPAGAAKLGYGNSPSTVVGYGTNAMNKFITTYFRTTFVVQEPWMFTNLNLGLLRDDGAVVYLNGVEVFRANMPEGPIHYRTLARAEVTNGDDTKIYWTNIHAGWLVTGTNLLAVETHLAATNDSDMGFDLVLNADQSSGWLFSSSNPALPGQQPVTFSLRLFPVPNGAGMPTGVVQFKLDGMDVGEPVPITNGVADCAAPILAHGTHIVCAQYGGDAVFTGTTNLLVQVVDIPPVAAPDIVDRTGTNGTKISIATLLFNDFDPDGEPFWFTGVIPISAHGGLVVSNENWVFYTPAAGFTNDDTFTYMISDGLAGPVSGTVTVRVKENYGESPNLSITNLEDGTYLIRGDGIPQRSYHIQAADEPTSPSWETLDTVIADTNGIFLYSDRPAAGRRFYRTIYP